MLRQTVQLRIDFERSIDEEDVVEDRVFLRKRSGESMKHVAMKLASYLVYYSPQLEIEKSVDQHYKPDLVVVNDLLVPTLWIDCGATTPKKLERIVKRNREADFVIVKPTPQNLSRYKQEALKKISDPRISYLSLTENAVYRIAERLVGRHRLVWTQEDDSVHLTLDSDELEFELFRLSGLEDETEKSTKW